MVSLLLIISFLLHIILLIAIYFLYQQIEQLKRDKNSQLETTLSNFLNEIKAENERLQLQIKNENNTVENKVNHNRPNVHFEQEMQKNMIKKDVKREYNYKPPQPLLQVEKKLDKLETSLEAQVFQLAEEGMSVEDIAKKLNRGKIEIELMLKLNQNQ